MDRGKDRGLRITFDYLKLAMPAAPGLFSSWKQHICFLSLKNYFEFSFYYLQSKKDVEFLNVPC